VPDYRVVPNALERYNLNNYSPLKKEADGSLKIGIGPAPVGGVPESNGLPSPEGKPARADCANGILLESDGSTRGAVSTRLRK